jgi:hypothetical protein
MERSPKISWVRKNHTTFSHITPTPSKKDCQKLSTPPSYHKSVLPHSSTLRSLSPMPARVMHRIQLLLADVVTLDLSLSLLMPSSPARQIPSLIITTSRCLRANQTIERRVDKHLQYMNIHDPLSTSTPPNSVR